MADQPGAIICVYILSTKNAVDVGTYESPCQISPRSCINEKRATIITL